MTSKSFHAVLIAALLAGSAILAAPALAADAKEPTVSKAVGKQLVAAQTAMKANDYQTALTDLQAAQAVDSRTDFDNYKINQYLTIVEIKMNNMAAAEAPAFAAADSPAIPDADKSDAYYRAMAVANDNKHFDKTIKYGKQFEALGQPNPQVTAELADAYLDSGDFANAMAYTQKVIAAETASGKKPSENSLQMVLNIHVKQRDEAGAEAALEQLAVNYNHPDDWMQTVDFAFGIKGLREDDVLHLGRLLYASGGTVSKDDANLVAMASNQRAFYGDVQTSVAKGASPVPGLAGKIAADEKSLSAQIAAGDKQGGEYNVKLAEALYGYGRFADSEAAARRAIAKGGTKDASEAPMVLGEALFAQQKYADAEQAFASVKGGGPATGRIAQIWRDFAHARSLDAAAPAAKPAP